MGGIDKGLALLDGQPLIARVLECISPQVDEVLISANRNLEQYQQFGHTVLTDISPDFQGPLAGLSRAMTEATHPLVLCVPCDTPLLPDNLADRLLQMLERSGAEIAITAVGNQVHHAIFLCRHAVLPSLNRYLEQGGRRVGEWQSRLRCVEVSFDDEKAFLNLNTPDDLALLNTRH